MQALRSILGVPFDIRIAFAGHTCSHFRQPTQAVFSTPGRAAMYRRRKPLNIVPALPRKKFWNCSPLRSVMI
jgi:hypothetical protein